MRTYPIALIVCFLFSYIVVSYFGFTVLKKLFNEQKQKYFQFIYSNYSLLLLLCFIFLYIYPNRQGDASNYSCYFKFNALFFTDFLVKIPISIAGIGSIFIHKKNILKFAALIIASGFCFGMIYGFVFGSKQIRVSNIEIGYSALPHEFNDYKIVQLSDIHLGNFWKMKSILEKTAVYIGQIKPDLILFTGDLVNNFVSETEGWENAIRKITSLAESYSILGNHDYGDYTSWENNDTKTENLNKIISSHHKFGFQILRNQNTIIKSGNDSIFLVGVENWKHNPLLQYADFEKASEGIPENAFTILMSHDPAHWESQIKWGKSIDLTLSGHTHGAQWGINIAGIPFSVAYFTRNNWGGLYRYENSFLNVNTGLSMVGTLLRIDMPAEISVITLKRGEVNRVQ